MPLRHGAASALLAHRATPAVVQKQLRHGDPRITLGVYAHAFGNQQRDAVETRLARIQGFSVNEFNGCQMKKQKLWNE
jgi:integrase